MFFKYFYVAWSLLLQKHGCYVPLNLANRAVYSVKTLVFKCWLQCLNSEIEVIIA